MTIEFTEENLDLVDQMRDSTVESRDSAMAAAIEISRAGPQASLDSSEVHAEHPPEYVPVEVIVQDRDKLERLREWAKEHKKEVVVVSTLATGATAVLVGAAWALKHLKEKEERSKK